MTSEIAERKTRIIHPFLFGIYPAMFLFSKNVGEITLSSLLLPLLLTIASTFILMQSLKHLVKDRNKLGIILAGFWFYFFAYGNVYGKLSKLTIGGKLVGTNIFLIPAWTAVFLLAVLGVLIFKKNVEKLTRILNVTAACLVVMCLATISVNLVKTTNIKKQATDIDIAAGFPDLSDIPSELPDIYYIILDERVRSDILKEFFGYDDSAFLAQLADRGFFVAEKSYSNYDKTRPSLTSTLHGMYIDDLVSQYSERSKRTPTINAMFKTNRVLELVKKCGYTTVSFANGYATSKLRNFDILYYKGPSLGPALDEYTNELISNTVITGAFTGFAGRQTIKSHQERILYSFDKLCETAKLASPHFVFCHIISPHTPYVFDENGLLDRPDKPFRWGDRDFLTRQDRDRKYVAQLKFINKKTIEVLDSILANSKKPPVIILQSDHGVRWKFGSGTVSDYRTTFGILNAYYFPGSDYSQLYESISPVNSFRVILNRYFGANLEMLEDRSYHSTSKKPLEFTEKTEDIK